MSGAETFSRVEALDFIGQEGGVDRGWETEDGSWGCGAVCNGRERGSGAVRGEVLEIGTEG